MWIQLVESRLIHLSLGRKFSLFCFEKYMRTMPKRSLLAQTRALSKRKRAVEQGNLDPRVDPKIRGVVSGALKSEKAVSGRAACVDCGKLIAKGDFRVGIKYAGNPVSEPVIPLYGTYPVPMYMWFHGGGCGLAYYILQEDDCPAKRTCHACQDTPGEVGELRLLCGGGKKGKKVQSHPFHFKCWKAALVDKELMVDPQQIGRHKRRGLRWEDLTPSEQELVKKELS
jgi:hypothetical protein